MSAGYSLVNDPMKSSLNMSLYDSDRLNLPHISSTSVDSSSTTTQSRSHRLSGFVGAPDNFTVDLLAMDDKSSAGASGSPIRRQRRNSELARQVKFREGGSDPKDSMDIIVDEDPVLMKAAYAKLEEMNSFLTLPSLPHLSSSSSKDHGNLMSAFRNEMNANAAAISEVMLAIDHTLYDSMNILSHISNKMLNTHTLERYAECHFVYERPTARNMQAALNAVIDKMLSFHCDPLKSSLTNLSSTMLINDAMVCNKYIQCFMGDRKSNRPHLDVVGSLLSKMLNSPSELHDEIYCQLMKQTRKNPSSESTELGWQLMLICLVSFPPSRQLLPFMFNYIATSIPIVVENAAKFVYLSLKLCLKSATVSIRREIPSAQEIQAVLLGELTEVNVFLIDKSVHQFYVDSFSTVRELEDQICTMFNILPENRRIFSLFEINSEMNEERVLDAEERLLDILANWSRLSVLSGMTEPLSTSLHSPLKTLHSSSGSFVVLPMFRLIFKVHYFFGIENYSQDLRACQLLFDQALHDVHEVLYPYSVQDAILLAALQLQATLGDYIAGHEILEIKGKALFNFIAKSFIPEEVSRASILTSSMVHDAVTHQHSVVRAEIESKIVASYRKLMSISKQDARVMYLTYINSWKLYGATVFIVNVATSSLLLVPELSGKKNNGSELQGEEWTEIALAVGPKCLVLVDVNTNNYLSVYTHDQISSWGHSFDAFVLVVGTSSAKNGAGATTAPGNSGAQVKSYFQTSQGKDIDDLLRVYQHHYFQTSAKFSKQ